MANETPKSLVRLDNWAQTRPEEESGAVQSIAPASQGSTPDSPISTTVKKDGSNDNSAGTDNVITDETPPPPRPANWREAVQDHFTPKPKEREFGNMQDVIDYLEERKAAIHLPTKEELEKERRRKKTEGIISAIADGASAVSNLIFTTQYAPDMYRHEDSMTEKMKERYDRLKKERDADADRYLNYALTIGKLKDAQEAKEYQRGRDALQDRIRISQETRAQLKADRDAAMADLRMQLMEGRISQQEAAARIKEIEAEYADQYYGARVDELKSRTRKNDRWQPSAGRGGSGGKGRHPWKDVKGEFGKPGAIIYETSAEGAREMAATHGGVYLTAETIRTTDTTDAYGRPKHTVSRTSKSTAKNKTNIEKWKKP